MRVWLVTCILLFILVELYQWVKGFILPLPIYVLAGAFLAIASNYDKGMSSLLNQSSQKIDPLSQSATLIESLQSGTSSRPQSIEGEKITPRVLESERTFNEE